METIDVILKANGGGTRSGAASAKAIHNTTGMRLREYPLTLDNDLDLRRAFAWS